MCVLKYSEREVSLSDIKLTSVAMYPRLPVGISVIITGYMYKIEQHCTTTQPSSDFVVTNKQWYHWTANSTESLGHGDSHAVKEATVVMQQIRPN